MGRRYPYSMAYLTRAKFRACVQRTCEVVEESGINWLAPNYDSAMSDIFADDWQRPMKKCLFCRYEFKDKGQWDSPVAVLDESRAKGMLWMMNVRSIPKWDKHSVACEHCNYSIVVPQKIRIANVMLGPSYYLSMLDDFD